MQHIRQAISASQRRGGFSSAIVAFFTRALLVIVLQMGLVLPAHAAENGGWWNKDWSYRRAVTVDTSPSGGNIGGAVGRAVVLVRLHSGDFTFTDAAQNGSDIRFVDSDNKTPLPFQIEKYDATNGLATIWVSVANLNGGEKRVVWLYFGNKNAPAGSDAKATFDPDYMAVYHFNDALGQPSSDSTANLNGAKTPPPGIDEGGVIGQSGRFLGQAPMEIAASGSLVMPAGAPFTFSAWVKPNQLAGDAVLLSRGAFTIGLHNGVPFARAGGAAVSGKTALKQGDWSHVSFVADGKALHLYINGIEDGVGAGAMPAIDGSILIGQGFTGELDEVRLSHTARPANMILAMAQAEGQGGKLVSVADTAEKQSSDNGVLAFIVSKLKPVDAVIIGLCMILLAMAMALIVAKIRYLNASRKGNNLFFKHFYAMHENLVPLSEVNGVSEQELAVIDQFSPTARLYEVGISELEVRNSGPASRVVTAESIQAMRAAVDAQLVEENQKLDHLMVILTIAISGGPFIGLLGTVVGVMTVFGDVAMAGDVNVTAIAPGIAAALLATIAGLACAIPALFGYNYLNSRISGLNDQMRVFVDRLITRLAEVQSQASFKNKA